MTVTHTWTIAGYGSGNITATLPSGTGGILIAVAARNASNTEPQTPANWNVIAGTSGVWSKAQVKTWWALASSTPNLVFTRSTGESGVGIIRISDADVSTPSVVFGYSASAGWQTTYTLPNVSSAPNGTALALLGLQDNDAGVTSSSLGFTPLYQGYIGDAEWHADHVSMLYLEGITPSGGTFTSGTITSAGDDFGVNALVVVVKTAGAPPPTTSPFKFWNGSAWVPATIRHGAGWPEVPFNTL